MRNCGLLLGVSLCIAFASLTSRAQAPAAPAPGLSPAEAISLYARGEFDAAVERLETRNLLVRQFTRALDAWVAQGDAAALPRRKRVAAAFALDAGWHATRRLFNVSGTNADPWNAEPSDIEKWRFAYNRAQPVLAEWVVGQLAPSKPESLDGLLTLAAVGFAQDGHAWYRLDEVLVPQARKLLGDLPRLRLAAAIARTNRDLGTLRVYTWLARIGALRDDTPPNGAARRIGGAIKVFIPLLSEPAVAAEVELRIGYLELRHRQWASALARFESARLNSTDAVVRATADYFAGWVHEQLGQSTEAIEAYRRAHAFTPVMRNLTTRLSSLLFLRGERSEAFELLDAALNARPAPLDLIFVFENADARLVPEQLVSIRKALR